MIKRNLTVKGFIQIETIHANNTAATAISYKAVIAEAAITYEQASRPIYPSIEFTLKRVKVCCRRPVVMLLRLQQIRLASKHKAAVYLLPGHTEAAAWQMSKRAEYPL